VRFNRKPASQWFRAEEYYLDHGYIRPKKSSKLIQYDPFDTFLDDQDSQPIYLKLANIYVTRDQQKTYGRLKTSLEEQIMGFAKEFGLLGVGLRYVVVLPGQTDLANCEVILEEERRGMYIEEGERSRNSIQIKGERFFPPFFPGQKLSDISETDMLDSYSEAVGELLNHDSDVHHRPIRNKKNLEDGSIESSFNTIGFHISLFGEHFLRVVNNKQIMDSSYDGLIRSQPISKGREKFLPRQELRQTNKGTLWSFPSLLDACYVMLELDHTAGREITQCPWCGSYNRFTKSAPPNARYCPPGKGQSKQQSCSARFASFKFKQRRSWNEFLRKTYEDEQKIAEAWGISSLRDYEWWDETVKDPVLHPNDMVERHALTPKAKDDYGSWKKTLHRSNPRHKLVLNDKEIRGDDGIEK